jgi:hypothetical protein
MLNGLEVIYPDLKEENLAKKVFFMIFGGILTYKLTLFCLKLKN